LCGTVDAEGSPTFSVGEIARCLWLKFVVERKQTEELAEKMEPTYRLHLSSALRDIIQFNNPNFQYCFSLEQRDMIGITPSGPAQIASFSG
jgi:hypothetical protein